MSDLSMSKYVPMFLVYLYEHRNNQYCSHNELCLFLNLKKNNLSNIVKRLEGMDILDIKKEGRNKYYRLTPNGIKLYESLLENDNEFYYQSAKDKLRK